MTSAILQSGHFLLINTLSLVYSEIPICCVCFELINVFPLHLIKTYMGHKS